MNLNNKSLASEVMRNSVNGQIQALEALVSRIDDNFTMALELLAECRGRAILFGMEQSGLVGQKVAATLHDTGLSTHMLSAAETWEDNLSMIGSGDVIIMLSYSGQTEALLRLYPTIRTMGNKVIAITADPAGPVAAQADIVLDASVEESRKDRAQAPTTYTTVLLTIGDLLAEALIHRRLRSSPEARQSDQKMLWVRDVVERCDLATVTPDCSLREVIQAMTSYHTNLCLVMDGDSLCGTISDEDLRRNLASADGIQNLSACNMMNAAPVCVQENISAQEAHLLMKQQNITTAVVKNSDQNVVGLLSVDNLFDT